MKDEVIKKLLYIPIAVMLLMSIIFGTADAHPEQWEGNPTYFEAFRK